MLSFRACHAFVVGMSVIWNIQVNCKRVDHAAVKLAIDSKPTFESVSQSNNNSMEIESHRTVLSKYNLECRCERRCDKEPGSIDSVVFGQQTCQVKQNDPKANKNKKGKVCAPGSHAYSKYCQELVEQVVDRHAIRCDPKMSGVKQREYATRFPTSVGIRVQTNKLSFLQCVDEVLRLSQSNQNFQKQVEMRISSPVEVTISLGKTKLKMPECRCKKVWISKPLERSEALTEGSDGPGCSRSCKESRSCQYKYQDQVPRLKELSNEMCNERVEEYCMPTNAELNNVGASSGMCTQSWRCTYQGECREHERVQRKTRTGRIEEFQNECGKCCEWTYDSRPEILKGARDLNCGPTPQKKRKWIDDGSQCTGETKKRAGAMGHGECKWYPKPNVRKDLDASTCRKSSRQVGGNADGDVDYEEDDEC